MAKRFSGSTETHLKSQKFGIFKHRLQAKSRAVLRIVRAKEFIYMDKKALVGAFSNEDLPHFLEHIDLLVEKTAGIYSELQAKAKKGDEPTNTRKKSISDFDAMLERVKKESK